MKFKGGLINGVLASLYGGACYFSLLLLESEHDMKNVGYVLGVVGILMAIYWLATNEVMGIPLFIVGLLHISLAGRSGEMAMQSGVTGLAVVSFVIGVIMLTRLQPMGAESRE